MNVRLIYTFILILTLICAGLLIKYSSKRRAMPGANYFIVLMIISIIYNAAYIGEINSTTFVKAKFWFDVEHLAIPLQHYMWAMMSLDFINLDKKKFKLAKYILLYHPILYYIVYYTNNIHHLYISQFHFQSNGYFFVLVTDKEILYTVMVLSGTLLGVISSYFYIHGYIKSSRQQHHIYVVMLIAAMFPWAAVYLNLTSTGYLGIDYFPVITIVSGILFMLGIFRFRMFSTIPIATEIIFNQAQESMLLVDLMDRIIFTNKALLNLYPEIKSKSKSKSKLSLSSFIQNHPELDNLLEGKENFDFAKGELLEKQYYNVNVTKILIQENFEIGKIIAIKNITYYVNIQNELKKLAHGAMDRADLNEISYLQAQIKPHFINNTLSTIASMVTRAPVEAKTLITDLSEYLMHCYYFDENTPMNNLEQELEALQAYVNIEKARFGKRLEFNLIYDNIPSLQIPKLILQPLVENAIMHGILKKAEGGTVSLRITQETDYVKFEISDNGVGISEEILNTIMIGGTKENSIGITNVNKRLIKYYQQGLTITSIIGEGTTVLFSIPEKSYVCSTDNRE